MNVPSRNTALVFEHKGFSYYFCAEACRKAFEMNPNNYLEPAAKKRKGLWGRYLERLNRATGGRPLKCH